MNGAIKIGNIHKGRKNTGKWDTVHDKDANNKHTKRILAALLKSEGQSMKKTNQKKIGQNCESPKIDEILFFHY